MAEEKSFTMTAEAAVDAKRMFEVGRESNVLLPKLLPQVFTSITLEGGNGEVGTVRHIVFTPEAQKENEFGFLKERVDEIDENNMLVKYTVVEGGLLGKRVATAHGEIKVSPGPGGKGCVVSQTSYFTPLPGVPPPPPEKVQHVHESFAQVTKALDTYLLSHP